MFTSNVFQTLSKSVLLSKCKGKLINHGLPRPASFEAILSKMHANLYVSTTEAIPNVVVDSLSHFVPVLTSDTTELFDGNPMLKDLLVVNRLDDSIAIYTAAKRAILFAKENSTKFQKEASSLLKQLELKSVHSWQAALSCRRCPVDHDVHCMCEEGELSLL